MNLPSSPDVAVDTIEIEVLSKQCYCTKVSVDTLALRDVAASANRLHLPSGSVSSGTFWEAPASISSRMREFSNPNVRLELRSDSST